MTETFKKELTSSKTYAKASEELLQTLVLTNDSEYDITAVTITANVGEGATVKTYSPHQKIKRKHKRSFIILEIL